VVAVVDDNGAAPPELELAWQCERWHALPDTGAMLDQDARTMFLMAAYSNIHDTMTRLRNASGEEIHSLTTHDRQILRILIDMGLIFNG